ncbi:hypothetical protein, partial [Tychonema bourrellyi]|uniref:hypothetical protein n=1 Tax=Tychonema bourrellyi TaxID=54313 RepID=UPI001C55790A
QQIAQPHWFTLSTINPPCFLRGARGDLDLIVKQQSLTGFELKLTPMGSAVSLQFIWVGTRHCRVLHIIPML